MSFCGDLSTTVKAEFPLYVYDFFAQDDTSTLGPLAFCLFWAPGIDSGTQKQSPCFLVAWPNPGAFLEMEGALVTLGSLEVFAGQIMFALPAAATTPHGHLNCLVCATGMGMFGLH